VSQAHRVVEQEFGVSAERLWEAIQDHESMSKWLPARVSMLASGGVSGVGKVLRVRTRGLVIDEEVVYADPPVDGRSGRLVLRIIRGLPIRFHRAEILIEPLPAREGGRSRSRLVWDVVLSSSVPGLAVAITRGVGPVIARGLRTLDGLISS
jgi:hypothetical protein